MNHRPNDVTPEDVTIAKGYGQTKIRFTLDGKRYKMLIADEDFERLATEPGQLIKELSIKE